MRRRVSLYIVDRLVDLDDGSFILFNWAQEDLSNPTVVKNSYTQQITLKGTPGNNAIFGDYFRVDRRMYDTAAQTGVGFNPSARTPFTLYNELNEVLQSGYVKLDQVSVSGQDIQYQVTLYGGLGSFFYALSYDEEGNKRTLADLDYLGLSNPASELDFKINASSVRAAWNSLASGSTSGMWSVVNFAPCYNGIPEGNFSADKAIAMTTALGLQDTYTDGDGKKYISDDGYTLISFQSEYDEWQVKDLRSYLQRPIFSIRAFLDAVCNPDNNGGYEVDMSAIGSSDDFPYQDLWMTLPMLSDSDYSAGETRPLTYSDNGGSSQEVGVFLVPGTVASGSGVSASLSFSLQYEIPSATVTSLHISETYEDTVNVATYYRRAVLFVQVVAYNEEDEAVGGSLVTSIYQTTGSTVNSLDSPDAMASQLGFTPWYIDGDEPMFDAEPKSFSFLRTSDGLFRQSSSPLDFSLDVQNAVKFKVMVAAYSIETFLQYGAEFFSTSSGGALSTPTLYYSYDEPYTATVSSLRVNPSSQATAFISASSIRSNADITKAVLLTLEHTPAEYLLSFCKIFGLVFTYDNASRKVAIMRRNDFYQDETVDLTDRVDRSQDITVKPITFDAKWYVFSLESDGGAMSDRYEDLYGQAYGIQRVNTGYDFDANTTELLDGCVFRSAVTVLESSKYFNTMENLSGRFQPSVFQDKGSTYSLYDSDMESVGLDVPVLPRNATVEYFNPANAGYDIRGASKPQLHDSDGKSVDGSGILVMMKGTASYPYFNLSDDDPRMYTLNDGEPCWYLNPGPSSGLSVPVFGAYIYDSQGMEITRSLDFGVPQELYIPGLEYPQGSTIYAQAWQKYLADRYDVNTKVMTCKVDFRGMQVGQELLRKFYYYGGSLWVINSISNYSMTTWDLAEVELVQVQDKDNYLNGQY